MKSIKTISRSFLIVVFTIIIFTLSIFNYLESRSIFSNSNNLKGDINSKLAQSTICSLLLGIFIAAILLGAYVIFSNRRFKIGNISKKINPVDDILTICKNLNDYAEEAGASMNELANFTDDQAAYVEQFSAALEEVSSGVQETSENTQHAASLVANVQGTVSVFVESIEEVASVAQQFSNESENARDAAKDGEKVVLDAIREMNTASERIKDLANYMTALETSTDEIGSILNVINNIANQTNMLALNASIEAARAGEYGKGFSVVAGSIKDLADKSKDATNGINEIIKNIQIAIKEAVSKSNKGLNELESGMYLVRATGESIEKILTVVGKTYNYSVSLTESTKLQDESSKEIMNSVNELNDVISNISVTTTEESASIQQVAAGVEIIKESIDELATGNEELVTFTNYINEGVMNLLKALEVNN